MQAVILAAGEGKRLRPLTESLPKGLIEIGVKTLLEHSLGALGENGIKEVIIVAGFLSEAIKKKLGEEYYGLKITYVLNPDYYKTGSMYSFSKVKDKISGDVLLLESDLLYDAQAIKLLLNSGFKDCLLVARARGSGDEVYICVDKEAKIIALGKDVKEADKKNAIGELVGISKFSAAFLHKLFKNAEKDFARGKLDYHYEEAVFATSILGNPVYALFCADLAWTEIDSENDLKRAKEQIYPIIERDKKNG